MEWKYTRTWRRHYVDDGEMYGTGIHHWLWDISSRTSFGFVPRKEGYDLWHKGKFLRHGKTVKELKLYAENEQLKEQNQ